MPKTMLDKETSDKLIRFYGGRKQAENALRIYNKPQLIMVCPNCSEVDIDVIKHVDECDPIGQAQRQYDWNENVGDRG